MSLTGQNVTARSPLGDPPAAAIRQVQPHPEIDMSKCHFVERVKLLDVDVRFVGTQVQREDSVEAIADPSAHESCAVSRLVLERDGRPSEIKTEYPTLSRRLLGAGVDNGPEAEKDRETPSQRVPWSWSCGLWLLVQWHCH